MGYRYFDSFEKEVSYPFGYGLSYTNFEFEGGKWQVADGKVSGSVTVKNVGKVAGKEVVQLYVSAPGANKPAKELKAFAKTKELAPGESQTIELSVNVAELASYDEAGSQWVVESGEYQLLIGNSSRNILLTENVSVEGQTEKTNDLFKLKYDIQLLSR